jgi:hypothetical protein
MKQMFHTMGFWGLYIFFINTNLRVCWEATPAKSSARGWAVSNLEQIEDSPVDAPVLLGLHLKSLELWWFLVCPGADFEITQFEVAWHESDLLRRVHRIRLTIGWFHQRVYQKKIGHQESGVAAIQWKTNQATFAWRQQKMVLDLSEFQQVISPSSKAPIMLNFPKWPPK